MARLSKSDLIDLIATDANTTKAQAKQMLESVMSVFSQQLIKGNEVVTPELGTLKVTSRAARTGKNPRTGEAIQIAEKKGIKLSVAKSLSDALNK